LPKAKQPKNPGNCRGFLLTQNPITFEPENDCMITIEQLYKIYLQHPQVQTDTRKLQAGHLFFALKGPNFNGNAFALQALEAGAAYVVVDETPIQQDERIVQVPNVLEALQQLAKYHRQQFSIPFIAITGSNGKTTTKELVSSVLSAHYKTYTTQGNYNNHIGVPLTLLSIQADAAMAVIEMGANHQKEIESYCTYTLPTHALITNCGKAHLEGFGGIEGVRKGKGELYNYIRENGGTIFRYEEYDYLKEMSQGIADVQGYGINSGIVQGYIKTAEPYLLVGFTAGTNFSNIATQLVGDYNLPNVLCAVAIGKFFKVPDEKIKAAIENYQPDNSRSQMLVHNNNHIILDAYNANPTSMRAAIENFGKLAVSPKIVMLGGMKELGNDSIAEHKAIVELIQQYQWKAVVLVGQDFDQVNHSFIQLNNSDEAAIWYQEQKFTEAHLLIKGSRSMQMEKIIRSS
jgi:UDP-N-acetylmuramoyl-tripeptide--D-alanyl-D-alanine ligase